MRQILLLLLLAMSIESCLTTKDKIEKNYSVAIPNISEQRITHSKASGNTMPKKIRLRLEVLETLPDPVIWKDNIGAESIPGGFEGGSSVKVIIDGQPEYHFFAHSYPTLGWGESQLDHWVSKDGKVFWHAGVLLKNYIDNQTGKKHIFCAPVPFFEKKENRWYLCYGEFITNVDSSWSPDNAIMWYASSKIKGTKGIAGPYDFKDSRKLVQEIYLPKPYNLTTNVVSNSAPFQVKDGRWALFICPNISGSWPISLAFGRSPFGPYSASETIVSSMIDPTGYIENPMPVKVKGPKSGKDYWVTVFDFLAPEVTDYSPKDVFGFCWSEDGINWPKEHGQAVNINNGLAPEGKGWWKGACSVRTPHQMIDEGNNIYTIFFTGASNVNHHADFRAVGRVRVKLIEEDESSNN